MSSDGKRIAGFFDGSLQAGTIENGGISWRKVWGGCGGSLSPDGKVMTRNGGTHSAILFHAFEGGLLYKDFTPKPNSEKGNAELRATVCPEAGAHWHRMHWPVNSSKWLVISQGNGYQIDEGSVPVLLKHDGSECVQMIDLVSDPDHKDGLHYEGSDFWFDYPVSTRKSAHAPSPAIEVAIESSAHSVIVSNTASGPCSARLFNPSGRLLSTASSGMDNRITFRHPGRSGVYLVQVTTGAGVLNRRVVLP
jgi:hypothetical protein